MYPKKTLAMQNGKDNGLCPCGSGIAPNKCCLPFISGKKSPKTAEELMRSRYTAYSLQQFVYVFETWHPDYRPSLKELSSDHNPPNWVRLNVLDAQMGKASDNYGDVEFEAYFMQNGIKHTMKERSEFIKENGRWLYTKGINRFHAIQ